MTDDDRPSVAAAESTSRRTRLGMVVGTLLLAGAVALPVL